MLTADALQTLLQAGAYRGDLFKTADGGEAMIVPTASQAIKFPPLEPPLTHIKQGVTLHTPTALIDYVKAYKTEGTRIFAEPGFMNALGKASFLVAFDYHLATAPIPEDIKSTPPAPDRLAHRAVYTPRYSEAWERWVEACGKPFTQAEFAEFIEECRADIVEPAAATMLDIVRAFKASKKQDFDSFIHEQSGSVKLHFSSEVNQTGTAILPEMIKLGIPVYYRTDRVEIDVWVRFRLAGGKVVFILKMDRPDRVEEHAFEELSTKIQSETAVPLHNGRF